MQELHCRHAFPLFWRLDSIGKNHDARVDLKGPEQSKAEADPAGSERVQIETLAVEEMQKAMVGHASKVQDADKAGDAGIIGTTAQADQDKNQPAESM
jgi:hypothetical protein